MSTTLSYQGVLYRTNVFAKNIVREFGGSSGEANKEFGSTVDLSTGVLPAFPYAISTQDVKTISFLFLQAIGGAVTVRLVKDGFYTAALNTTFVAGEVPVSHVDGVTFTLAHVPITNTLSVYANGARVTDYTVSGSDIVFASAPGAVVILADYYWSPSVNPTPLNTQSIDVTVGNPDKPTGDTLLMTGVDLSRIFIINAPKGCVVEIFGMGY